MFHKFWSSTNCRKTNLPLTRVVREALVWGPHLISRPEMTLFFVFYLISLAILRRE